MNKENVAKMIDHTLLAATATESQIKKLCEEAASNGFASVCVNPVYVPLANSLLKDSPVAVCTVIGFPLGAEMTSVKAFSASQAVLGGADEVDMVINIGEAKDGRFSEVEDDIREVVKASKSAGESCGKKVIVKVIIETCYLTDEEVVKACKATVAAGADFVKTSTGFATPKASDGSALPNGASVHHVRLMRETVGPDFGVKASGGIRSAKDALDMIEAGATRLGTSGGMKIISAL